MAPRQRKPAAPSANEAPAVTAPLQATAKGREFVLKVSHILDSGLGYVIPFAYGLYQGHDPLRLIIGFVVQSIAFVVLAVTVYGPFYPSSFYRAWDLVYRHQDLKCNDVNQWEAAERAIASTAMDAPPPHAWVRWIVRLVLRKGAGFHLLLALTTDSAFVVIPLVTLSAFNGMIMERSGASNVTELIAEIQRLLAGPPPSPPRDREETLQETDERQLKEIREGLDSTFGVGAPVCAAAIMVWWMGSRGKAWSQEMLGF